MEHLYQSINRQSPMKGACASIMNNSIIEYHNSIQYILESSFNPHSYKEWVRLNLSFKNWILEV